MRSDLKILLFSIFILLTIIFSGIFIKVFLQKTASKLNMDISNLSELIDKDNWKRANEKINILNNDWARYAGKWAIFINHHEIDNISSSLQKAVQYIKYNNKEDSAAYLSELSEYIDHIPDMENLSLKNIF